MVELRLTTRQFWILYGVMGMDLEQIQEAIPQKNVAYESYLARTAPFFHEPIVTEQEWRELQEAFSDSLKVRCGDVYYPYEDGVRSYTCELPKGHSGSHREEGVRWNTVGTDGESSDEST
jgi:hypothetical protein